MEARRFVFVGCSAFCFLGAAQPEPLLGISNRMISLIVAGAALGLVGGLLAGLFPLWRNANWGMKHALWALCLGGASGSLASLFFHGFFASLSDEARWFLIAFVGLIAQKILDQIASASLGSIWLWFLRRFAPLPPAPPAPPPKEEET